jgi:hypothetical protein
LKARDNTYTRIKTYIMVISATIKRMDKEYYGIKLKKYTKDNGKTII